MDDDRAMIEKDLEYLEDENQCLHDELEIATKELQEAKANSENMEEIKRLLAYFIYAATQQTLRGSITPEMLAARLGYTFGYGNTGQYYELALPSNSPASFNHPKFGPDYGPPHYDRVVIPNVELEKR